MQHLKSRYFMLFFLVDYALREKASPQLAWLLCRSNKKRALSHEAAPYKGEAISNRMPHFCALSAKASNFNKFDLC
nr:hypothetical protein Iba_scaffold276750CG0010 [Ipomoea batatas]